MEIPLKCDVMGILLKHNVKEIVMENTFNAMQWSTE